MTTLKHSLRREEGKPRQPARETVILRHPPARPFSPQKPLPHHRSAAKTITLRTHGTVIGAENGARLFLGLAERGMEPRSAEHGLAAMDDLEISIDEKLIVSEILQAFARSFATRELAERRTASASARGGLTAGEWARAVAPTSNRW